MAERLATLRSAPNAINSKTPCRLRIFIEPGIGQPHLLVPQAPPPFFCSLRPERAAAISLPLAGLLLWGQVDTWPWGWFSRTSHDPSVPNQHDFDRVPALSRSSGPLTAPDRQLSSVA